MKNIVCIKWGKLYSSEDVNILEYMIKKNTNHQFQLYCLTDDCFGINRSIEIISLPKHNDLEGHWNKMYLFNREVTNLNNFTYFDLDIIIQNNIDDILDYENKLTLIKTWWKDSEVWKNTYNSSVMSIDTFRDNHVWKKFIENPDYHMCKNVGDDDFLFNNFDYDHYQQDWFYSRIYGIERSKTRYYKPEKKICLLNSMKKFYPTEYYQLFQDLYPEYQYHQSSLAKDLSVV
jgi:hypothetical protein